MIRFIILVSVLCFLNGCARVGVHSPAEQESGYTYVPLDPFPVVAKPGKGCPVGTELDRGTLLQALPDNAVRMLIEQFDTKGKVSYGPSQVIGQGASYRVTIDYIYSDTKNQSIFVSKSVLRRTNKGEKQYYGSAGEREVVPINASPTFEYVPGSEEYKVTRERPNLEPPANYSAREEWSWSEDDGLARRNHSFAQLLHEYRELRENQLRVFRSAKVNKERALDDLRERRGKSLGSISDSDLVEAEQELKQAVEEFDKIAEETEAAKNRVDRARDLVYIEFKDELVRFDQEYTEFNIPIYLGLGLRTSSIIYAVKGEANISGLGVIGAEAEANNLKGSLIIQTLGVNGKSVAAALPIQSELNRTTAQNAIVAIGTIKALLHSPETWIAPRVVGLYLPFPGGKALVNALVSELSTHEIEWEFSCAKAEDSREKGNNANSVAGPNR